jgi:hypothetical protein
MFLRQSWRSCFRTILCSVLMRELFLNIKRPSTTVSDFPWSLYLVLSGRLLNIPGLNPTKKDPNQLWHSKMGHGMRKSVDDNQE